MKSFFKKLAFVMALAMVVSLAAPAGTALAANPLRVVDQDTNKVLKELTLEKVGDSQDLKYWDYFGDTPWNKVPNIWESSNEDVFTVDNVGLVTAVGEGEATLTITVGDYVGSIPVIVGEKVVTVAPTDVPATTPEAPVTTPEAPVTTPEAPVTTPEAPVTTPEAPVTTPEAPVTTPEAPVTTPAVEAIVAKAIADNTVRLTFADTKVNAAALKDVLELKYYVTEDYSITLQLIKSITDVKDMPGVVDVTLYTTMNDGDVYGFAYKGEEAKAKFTLGTVKTVIFTLAVNDGKNTAVNGYEVEVNDLGYVFIPKALNEDGCDITSTAMFVDGAYIDYVIGEGEAFWAIPDGIQFNEAATAAVTATYYAPNKDGEIVPVGTPFTCGIKAVAPTPWAVSFDTTPLYTIAENVNWDKFSSNTKFAVGDENKQLFVSITDNKGGEVRTNTVAYEQGVFRFESTNNEYLYVTDEGYLMPNRNGEVDVLVWFTQNKENAKEELVAVIPVKIEKERSVKTVTTSIDQPTLSTSALVVGANTAKVKVTIKDSLGDSVSPAVQGAKVEFKQTSTTPAGLTEPDTNVGTINDKGELTITIVADANSAKAGASATYSYKITVGGIERTFSVTVRAPKEGTIASYKLNFTGDKDIAVGDDNDVSKVLNVALVGMSNGVASKTLAFDGKYDAKTKASEALLGKYLYSVTKNNKDVAATLSASGESLDIALTTTATDNNFKATATASASSLDYVKDEAGSGTYTVTVWTVKYNAATKTYYYSKVLTSSETVADNEVTAKFEEKINPSYVIADPNAPTSDDVINAIKDCFKFTVGKVELAGDDDADYNNYELQADVNLVKNGNVCYVKKVTFWRNCGGTYVNCGTVSVNSTIEFTTTAE